MRLRLIHADQQHARRPDNLAEGAQLIVLIEVVIFAGHDDLGGEIEEAAFFAGLRQTVTRIAGLQLQGFFVDQTPAGEDEQGGRRGALRLDADGDIESSGFRPRVPARRWR